MRLLNYKCTGQSEHFPDECKYSGMMSERMPCLNCGKTYEETRTVWDTIALKYYVIVPYEYRPKAIWYGIKCWAFKRYTTVKPRTLGHGWCDKVNLVPHVIFEMLCDFVETELRDGPVDWDAFPDQAEARDKMEALYKWWTEEYDDEYPWNLPEEDREPLKVFKLEKEYRENLLVKCKEVVDLSPYMWT